MSLSPGTRFGPYAIVSKLGGGGMGEVYRGTDTRLGRDVAIKVLPATADLSPDALARFDREAKAIAALNHPNICTLFDVGSEQGQPYLVMELLAGSTLDHALAAGELPIPVLVEHAIALTDALQAAHAQGVIHRDLKPANIFVNAQGTIKILDFGLATATVDHREETRQIDAGLTGPGTVLGTFAYMSPEQLRGERVDGRSDLFSLGLVLYEMATGRRAFAGKTFAEVSGAILHQAPTPPAALRADVPLALDAIIGRALEKDRELRYQSAADLRADLKRLRREDVKSASASSAVTPSSLLHPSATTAALAVGPARRHRAVVAGIVLAVIAMAAVAWWAMGTAGTPSASRPEVSLQPLTFDGQAGDATISPDGRFVAYVRRAGSQSSVVVKQLSSDSDVTILPPRAGVAYFAPAVTPDGGYVDVLMVEPGTKISLVRLPFLGGAPRRIADNARSGVGWSPDGQRMAFIRSDQPAQNSLVVADAEGQNAKVLVTRRAPSFFLSITFGDGRSYRPSWSPDGRRITVIGLNTSPDRVDNLNDLVEVNADDGTERPLPLDRTIVNEAVYLDSDRWVASAIELGTDQASQWRILPRHGPPIPLTRDLSDLIGVQLTATRSAGVATRVMRRSAISLLDIATGSVRPVIEDSAAGPSGAALDAAGNIVYTAASASEPYATYRHSGPGGSSSLVATAVGGALPSPDGSFVIGSRLKEGLVRANADGSDARVLLADVTATPLAFTKDGALIYWSNREGHQQPWKLTLATGEAERLSDLQIFGNSFWLSPDDREVVLGRTGATRICAFPTFDACREFKMFAGPLSADGKTMFAVSRADRANIIAQPLDGSTPTPVTHFTDKVIVDFSLSPDRTRMVITRGTQISDVVLVKGLK